MIHRILHAVGLYTDTDLRASFEKGKQFGYTDGFAKGRKRFKRSPGYLKDRVHKKLDVMFGTDKPGQKAKYRWLKTHTLTTSHMSEMSLEELQRLDNLLNTVVLEEDLETES